MTDLLLKKIRKQRKRSRDKKLQGVRLISLISLTMYSLLLSSCLADVAAMVEREPTTPQSVKDGGDLAWFEVSS